MSKSGLESKDVVERSTTSPVVEEDEDGTARRKSSGPAGTLGQGLGRSGSVVCLKNEIEYVGSPTLGSSIRPNATSIETDVPSPPTFIPGHRRDLSTPSPNNSPARTPALESIPQLHNPQEAEVAVATPVEPNFGSRDALGQNKVRDLAGKFESTSSSRRNSSQSPTRRPGQILANSQKPTALAIGRPLGDRMESFRPHLPGGWESYASDAPRTSSNKTLDMEESKGATAQVDDVNANSRAAESPETPTQSKMATNQQQQEPHEDPFSSAAAAGSALAGAFAAAAGLGNQVGAQPEEGGCFRNLHPPPSHPADV